MVCRPLPFPHRTLVTLAFLCTAPAWAEPLTALVLTPDGEGQSALVMQPATALAPAEPVATFSHVPLAPVRASLIPNTQKVLVVTDLEPSQDLSFSGVLLLVEPGAPPRILADRIAHATRALVTAQGRIFVQRGRPGPTPSPGASLAEGPRSSDVRTDALSVDEVFLSGEVPRTVHRFAGQTAFLAGALGSELFVYRVGGGTADVAAVQMDTGRVRVVSTVLPFARDFSVDLRRRALLYTNRHPTDVLRFRMERLPLAGGAPEVLGGDAPHAALLPFAWPDGSVTYTPEGTRGLHRWSGEAPPFTPAPLGEGSDAVRALDPNVEWAALLHGPPEGGARKQPWLLERATGRVLPLAVPPKVRVEVAGFLSLARP